MKAKLKMVLMCLCTVVVLSLASCGSKVNQDELNKKIEAALSSDKSDDVKFTDEEYEFMAKYLLDKANEQKDLDPTSKEAEIIGEYAMLLGFANYEGKLKGNAKKTYEEFQNKVGSMMGGDFSDRNLPDFSDDSVSEVMEAVEVVEDSAVAVEAY